MRIRLLKPAFYGRTTHPADTVIDIDKSLADQFIRGGHAVADHSADPVASVSATPPIAPPADTTDFLRTLDFLTDDQRSALYQRDLDTAEKLRDAFAAKMDLTKVPGVGAATVKKIKASLQIE